MHHLVQLDEYIEKFTGNNDELYELGTNLLSRAKAVFQKGTNNKHSLSSRALQFVQHAENHIPRTVEIAFKEYEQKAEQNNGKAQFYLGVMYENGEGCKENPSLAMEYYMKASQNNVTSSFAYIGFLLQQGKGCTKNSEKAAEYFKKASDCGISQAQYSLGLMYEQGDGVKKDYSQALHYYELAADQDDTDAICNIGNMYYYGRGIKEDHEKAAKYFQRGAILNDPQSQLNFANMLMHGDGVTKSTREAIKYFKLAAQHNVAAAQYQYATICERGQTKEDLQEAVRYYRKAADQGHTHAASRVGRMMLEGLGCVPNPQQAAHYLEMAMEEPHAATALAELKHIGLGTPRDEIGARKIFEECASKGDALALAWVGEYLIADAAREAMRKKGKSKGKSGHLPPVPKEALEDDTDDVAKIAIDAAIAAVKAGRPKEILDSAIKNIRESSFKNCPRGKFDLAVLTMVGYGVTKDVELAMQLFNEAADSRETVFDFQAVYAELLIDNGREEDGEAYYKVAEKNPRPHMNYDLLLAPFEGVEKTVEGVIDVLTS